MRVRRPPSEFQALDLRVHALLNDVPLLDVSAVDLPGGGAGRRVADVRELLSSTRPAALTSALFSIRCLLGRLFGWDGTPTPENESYVARLSARDREASEIAPGTRDGAFRIVYQTPRESLGEVRNATVHGFLCMVLIPTAEGHRLYWAVYVKPVSRLTPVYLAMIEPFRRFIVYPSTMRRIHAAWITRYGRPDAAHPSVPPIH